MNYQFNFACAGVVGAVPCFSTSLINAANERSRITAVRCRKETISVLASSFPCAFPLTTFRLEATPRERRVKRFVFYLDFRCPQSHCRKWSGHRHPSTRFSQKRHFHHLLTYIPNCINVRKPSSISLCARRKSCRENQTCSEIR